MLLPLLSRETSWTERPFFFSLQRSPFDIKSSFPPLLSSRTLRDAKCLSFRAFPKLLNSSPPFSRSRKEKASSPSFFLFFPVVPLAKQKKARSFPFLLRKDRRTATRSPLSSAEIRCHPFFQLVLSVGRPPPSTTPPERQLQKHGPFSPLFPFCGHFPEEAEAFFLSEIRKRFFFFSFFFPVFCPCRQ